MRVVRVLKSRVRWLVTTMRAAATAHFLPSSDASFVHHINWGPDEGAVVPPPSSFNLPPSSPRRPPPTAAYPSSLFSPPQFLITGTTTGLNAPGTVTCLHAPCNVIYAERPWYNGR